MMRGSELENVCKQIITLLANALAGPTPQKEKVIKLSLVRKKLLANDELQPEEARLRHSARRDDPCS